MRFRIQNDSECGISPRVSYQFHGEYFRMSLLDLPRDIRSRRKRRGPRMNSRVPITVEWNGGGGTLHFETSYTRVVNSYGCLLVSPKELDLQQRIRVTNLATRQRSEAVVVWKGMQRPDGWDLGVEFVSADLEFWGVEL
jgi:hypothetical protein